MLTTRRFVTLLSSHGWGCDLFFLEFYALLHRFFLQHLDWGFSVISAETLYRILLPPDAEQFYSFPLMNFIIRDFYGVWECKKHTVISDV